MGKVLFALVPAVLIGGIGAVAPNYPSGSTGPSPNVYLSRHKVVGHITATKAPSHRTPDVGKTSSNVRREKTVSVPSSSSTTTSSRSRWSNIGTTNGMDTSANWAGYVVTPSNNALSYTSIQGSWVVPGAFGSPASMASQWIGLGGVTSNDLLQMGTIEQFEGRREVAMLFWEMLPSPATLVMEIPVGSKVSAKIAAQDSSDWSLDFDVVEPNRTTITKHITVTLDKAYAAGIGTSAEWISEDPAGANGSLYPLADTGVVTFTDATVNGQPISATGNQVHPTALVDAWGRVRIVPTALYSDGSSFSTISLGYPVGLTWSRNGWWGEKFGLVHHRSL